MKWKFLFVVFLICSSSTVVIGQDQPTVIVIDPGHGGKDKGAVSGQGKTEKDIVLDIAREMMLWQRQLKFTKLVLFSTRYSDTLIALSDRTRLFHTLKAEIFLSIHCNHAYNTQAKGIEIYIHTNNEKGKPLASALDKGLSTKLGFISRGIKAANFQVLRESKDQVSVLLELGFLSHKNEAEYLTKKETKRAIALCLLQILNSNRG